MKKLIALIFIIFLTACSQEKIYKITDTIEYQNLQINIVEDEIVTIYNNSLTDTNVSININIYNGSSDSITLSQEQWCLEVKGEKFSNTNVVNDFKNIASGETRKGTIIFSPTQYDDNASLIICFDDIQYKVKLDIIL